MESEGVYMNKSAKEIRKRMEGGEKPSEIIRSNPELADGLNDLIPAVRKKEPKTRSRGSGAGPTRLSPPRVSR